MQTKKDFKYASLFHRETGKYYTDASLPDLEMGPETAKRFAENDDCAVTICCITYKHEEYISHALDGFLMQKTNFKFKVFVGEDCGPDGTADIVREYAEKYPDIIVPFIREKNMGAQRNLIDLCQHATSPYIAFCEGDDYWVDENKLQKQYDYMQAHEDIRVCYSRAEISAPDDWFLRDWFKTDKEGKMIFPDCEPAYKPKKEPLTCFDCVWVFPAHTATVFYRWNYDVTIPEWYYTGIIGDHPIFLMQLGEGKAGFLPDVTAVYRRSNVGVYMSDSMDEHFLKTRLDHVRWMSGILDWYQNNQENYPKVPFENRIKQESYNYLKTAINCGNDEAVRLYFEQYPDAARVSLVAFLSFYNDSRALVRTCDWDGYQLIVRHRVYRQGLRVYAAFLKVFDKVKVSLRNAIKKSAKKLRDFFRWICYWFYTPVPKKKKLWVITSFRGKGYLDNAKYFYEDVLKNHPEIELYWLTHDDAVYSKLTDENKPVCKFGTRKCRKLLSHAYIAITDHNIMSDYNPVYGFNDRTKVVQLWHGVGFKAMGDGKKVKTVQENGVQYCDDILAKPGDSLLKRMAKKVKYFFCAHRRELFEKYFILVCPGQERVDMIGKMWNVPDENMFMAGHPRNILLYQMEPNPENPRILYAPTFRYDPKKEAELVDGCIDAFDSIEALMEKINGVFVLRLHPHTWRNYQPKIRQNMKKYKRIDMDVEKDVYTTLGLYNVIITDYSSISLDFAMLNRPAVYYCPDIVWFKEKQAGFNLDFEASIPGPLTGSWSETLQKVEEYVQNPDKDAAFREEKLKYFFDSSVNGPDNSERIVNEIKRRINLD